jgi:hypothetical protein
VLVVVEAMRARRARLDVWTLITNG